MLSIRAKPCITRGDNSVESVAIFFGKFLCYVGGAALGLALIALFMELAGELWIMARDKWSRILKAESMIFQFKKYREEFLDWMEEREEK